MSRAYRLYRPGQLIDTGHLPDNYPNRADQKLAVVQLYVFGHSVEKIARLSNIPVDVVEELVSGLPRDGVDWTDEAIVLAYQNGLSKGDIWQLSGRDFDEIKSILKAGRRKPGKPPSTV